MSWLTERMRRVKSWSLTSRLVLFFSLFAVITWSIGLGTAWRFDNANIHFFYDSHMRNLAKSLSDIDFDRVHGEVDHIEEILPKKKKKRDETLDETFSFAIFSKDGTRILSDDDGEDLPFMTRRGYRTVKLDDDDDDKWRIFVFPTRKQEYYIVVGQEMEHRRQVVLRILVRHMWPWLVLLPIIIMGLAWILRRELKPLRQLANNLQQRHAQDTSPLDTAQLTPETKPVVLALNALFERIASLLQQERAFVSNAAHELRTPLAGLRVQAEVMEMCMDDAEARENSLQKILEGTTRCTHLVEQLLLLSSLEAKSAQNKDTNLVGAIPWEILVHDAMDTVSNAAACKEITISLDLQQEPACQEGYGELWGIALRNLLDNAVRYTPHGGKVLVVMAKNSIYVENSAPHIAQEALQQLGQRFYRPPGQKERGSGLGLAIVGHIATLHAATLQVENVNMQEVAQGHGVRISILF